MNAEQVTFLDTNDTCDDIDGNRADYQALFTLKKVDFPVTLMPTKAIMKPTGVSKLESRSVVRVLQYVTMTCEAKSPTAIFWQAL